MADVGIGELATVSGRERSRKVKDAVSDNHPIMRAMKEAGGIRRVSGGRTILDEALSGQNSTAAWVGEAGTVSLANQKVADSPEFQWKYMLASISWTLAEVLKNGGSVTKFIDILEAKFMAAEAACQNVFEGGLVSDGTGSGGLQLGGLAHLISTTPTSGTVGGIDRSSANAAWFRNRKFDSSSDWSEGTVSASNVKRFLDKLINGGLENGKATAQIGLMGDTHYEFLSQALQAIQVINDKDGELRGGHQKLVYRGIPFYLSGGLQYSSQTQQTDTRTYLLNVERGGVNVVFHKEAEFDMLEPVDSSDQAARSRLIFTMANATVGAYAKRCVVGFD